MQETLYSAGGRERETIIAASERERELFFHGEVKIQTIKKWRAQQ